MTTVLVPVSVGSDRRFSVATDYEYNNTHKRDCITVWSGSFCSDHEATGYSLPGGGGYMLTLYGGKKIRVSCPCPRTEENYQVVDAAVCAAMEAATVVLSASSNSQREKMHIQRRINERRIVGQFLDTVLGLGYTVSVNDGGELVLVRSSDKDLILAAMFSVDEERLLIYNTAGRVGSVFLVYGNGLGEDVFADWSEGVEDLLAPALDLANLIGAEQWEAT